MVSGLFPLIETYGIPFDVLLYWLQQNDLVVDWIDFYEHSQRSGWTIKTTIDKIKYNLLDVYGKQYSDEVIYRLQYFIMQMIEK